ncbi:DUF7684 family protein [Acinetobacter wuhouensis]|uniref:DUF7684 domain-containing protein n=1 Tax=Acinetobacter wuhouensis TaxID=1879050 RepID=A0A3G2T4H7_9GAMM|nr:hypothetical protein [Acinetobacter wuhouensis]AYO54872.1 hypothetical protein CDG68_14960 [Acinetobacter wuhouensis]
MNQKPEMTTFELMVNQEILCDLPQTPYILVIAIHSQNAEKEWRYAICDWIVKSKQCYWALAWGYDCSLWDDALDWSYLESCNYELPDDEDYQLMTSWHENETLEDVMEFAESVSINTLPEQNIYQIVILNIC